MHAVTIVDGRLEWREHPDPQPGMGEVLVDVRAAGVCRGDLLQRAGFYPPPPGYPLDIPGLEMAGDVIALGPGASRFAVGDRVMAVVGGAGQAERAVVHERAAMPYPFGVPWEEAGGLPENVTTAHDALFTQCGLTVGERVCIHGAAGGVGTMAVQMAKAAGARVLATVRDEKNRDGLRSLVPGIEVVAPDEYVERGPYDVILELVGGGNLQTNIESLATGGRISIIGVGAGAKAELDLLALMGKRGRIYASTLRARPLEQKADAARRVEQHVLPAITAGQVRVPIAATFDMADAQAAYDRFEAGGKLGKIVLVR
jgi:putative PIG3 family NAD(P)H quinone oxidoreductase